jgi:hypothetical protein
MFAGVIKVPIGGAIRVPIHKVVIIEKSIYSVKDSVEK